MRVTLNWGHLESISKVNKKSAEKLKIGIDKSGDLVYYKEVVARARQCGSIAQLGEHLPYKQRVIGSSPIVPTIWCGSSVG